MRGKRIPVQGLALILALTLALAVTLALTLAVSLVLTLAGCAAAPMIPAGWTAETEHRFNDGEQFTEFCRYEYGEDGGAVFRDAGNYRPVTAEDVAYLSACADGFADWILHCDFAGDYDFDASLVGEGDYYLLSTGEGKTNNLGDQFDRYALFTLCYFDASSGTLYYLHNKTY